MDKIKGLLGPQIGINLGKPVLDSTRATRSCMKRKRRCISHTRLTLRQHLHRVNHMYQATLDDSHYQSARESSKGVEVAKGLDQRTPIYCWGLPPAAWRNWGSHGGAQTEQIGLLQSRTQRPMRSLETRQPNLG